MQCCIVDMWHKFISVALASAMSASDTQPRSSGNSTGESLCSYAPSTYFLRHLFKKRWYFSAALLDVWHLAEKWELARLACLRCGYWAWQYEKTLSSIRIASESAKGKKKIEMTIQNPESTHKK